VYNEILYTIFSFLFKIVMFMNGYYMYFKQGHDVLSNFEEVQTELSNQVCFF